MDDKLKNFGNLVKSLREAEGLSQEDLAIKAGFAGRASISAIEKGKNNISIEKLPKLAYALHTTPGKLMDAFAEYEETSSLTDGLTAENKARLQSYADYLRSMQGE